MDIQYLLFLQEIRSITHQLFNNFFLFITTFGEDFLIMAVISGCYWCLSKKTAFYLLFNFHIGNVVNQVLKITACVYRPWVREPRILPVEAAISGASGYSFPSGHTAKAAAMWGGLAVSVFRRDRLIKCFLFTLVLTVGFSRNYLGVHTPQDVLVSLILGGILLFVTEKLIDWVESKNNRDIFLMFLAIILSCGIIGYAKNKTYPLDYINSQLLVNPEHMINGCFRGIGGFAGLLSAWCFERRFLHYDECSGTWKQKLIKYLFGMLGLTIVFKVFPPTAALFLSSVQSAILNGFLVPFYIVGIYPMLVSIGIRHKR